MTGFFSCTDPVPFGLDEGPDDVAFLHYDPDEMLGDKSMAEHLRFIAAHWHSFEHEVAAARAEGTDPPTAFRPSGMVGERGEPACLTPVTSA